MKYLNSSNKTTFLIASALAGAILSGCSSFPDKTLDGKPIRQISSNVPVPVGSVLIAAICVPDKKAEMDTKTQIRFAKIFEEGFGSRRMKFGYPEKRNDSYWLIQNLGDFGKIQAFVLPRELVGKQNLSFLWNIRDRRINYEWTPWLAPDLKIKDISGYVKEDWGLVGKEDYVKEHNSPFLVKFKRIHFRDLILEQINHWNIHPIEPCEVGDVSKDIWLKPKQPSLKSGDSEIDQEKLQKDLKMKRIIKEVEVSTK